MMPFRHTAVLCIALLLCGCGNPGSPLPPSLLLPEPVTDLAAARTGNEVTLHWTMTRRATDRVKLEGDQRAVLCRALASGPCTTVGVLLLTPGQPAAYSDTLTGSLAAGAPRLLRYEVHLQNHAKHESGISNLAFAIAGTPPPAVAAVKAAATAEGIAVRWQATVKPDEQAPQATLIARLQRVRAEAMAPQGKSSAAGIPQPAQQTLEAPQHAATEPGSVWQPDHTLDTQAALDHSYRYTVQLVAQETLGGHTLEIAGLPGSSDLVAARDVFPPAAPAGLAVVPNADGGTIDLSWAASPESDTAGYYVYRQSAASTTSPSRVSGNAPLPAPAWSDPGVHRGERYAYSVSAIDASGNESPQSAQVTATMPQ